MRSCDSSGRIQLENSLHVEYYVLGLEAELQADRAWFSENLDNNVGLKLVGSQRGARIHRLRHKAYSGVSKNPGDHTGSTISSGI